LARVGAPPDLVQWLPSPVSEQSTAESMALCDLVVATGSQANVRAAYASGTPAFGVGAGNVAGIVDETADVALAAERIVTSKTFDNATSCSSENSRVIVDAVRAPLLAALQARGALLLDGAQKAPRQALMWPGGKLSPAVIGQSATAIAHKAGWPDIAARNPGILMVEEEGIGHAYPFSGENLSPVLALYRAADFDAASNIVERLYAFEGAGH
jgi:sulfoacetaldehyde dehydrogenase